MKSRPGTIAIIARISCLLIFFLLVAEPLYAADQGRRFRVSVMVSGSDSLKKLVASYITKELRSLPDVVVVEKEPEYTISIVATELKRKKGYTAGFVLSLVELKLFDTKHFLEDIKTVMFPNLVPEGIRQYVETQMPGLCRIHYQQAITGSEKELSSTCSTIVANFDRRNLEPLRPERQKTTSDRSKEDKKDNDKIKKKYNK
jgi:hypothetical protein